MTAVLATVNSGQGTGTTARTITYPTIGAGELCLVFVTYGLPNATLTPPTGLTAITGMPSAVGANVYAGWVVGGTGGTTYTPSVATRDIWFTCRITGASTTAPINVTSSTPTVVATSISTTSATTTVADTLNLSLFADFVTTTGVAANWTTPASTTLASTLSSTLAASSARWFGSLLAYDAPQAAAGATATRSSTATSGNLSAVMLAIAPGAAAAASPIVYPRTRLQAITRSAVY